MAAKPSKKKVAKKKVVKKKKKKDKKKYYVNPAEFLADITEYYDTDDLSEKLGESIYKIATGLGYAPNFINYSYKDEMIGDAILKMLTALRNKKFNIDSGNNPFSYFTTIAFHAFINRIKKEKKHRETITQYQEKVYFEMAQSTEYPGVNYTESTDENDSSDDS
tara:strand:- start:108 stop:599 length:492 start_codon:yes stop_codon:yes gene_type:complete